DLGRVGPDQARHLRPRLVQRRARLLAEPVQARRVAEPLAQGGEHGLQHAGVDGRGRVVVEVDALHAPILACARGEYCPARRPALQFAEMRPIVALLSDFGIHDHYVGAMKGAVLPVCPDAQLVDLVHELPPHDVAAGSFALAAAVDGFPAGAVFLAVVDPGVGSSRRALAMETDSHRFVAPDNGLLSLVLADHPGARVHTITNAGPFRFEVATTVHARDVCGPVAGHTARGMALEGVGPPASDARGRASRPR